MDLPEAGVITAVSAGVVGLVTAVFAGIVQVRKLLNAHQLAMAKVRADQYLVDFEELEDLRWWRRLAINVVNKLMDDYATREIELPIDVHKALDYPPLDRPRSKPQRRRHLDE